MDLGLNGTTAWVTGASKGIGRAVAEALAAEGARVALSARDGAALEEVAAGIRAAGGEALAVPADVRSDQAIADALGRVRQDLGDPLVLVVNAGGPPAGTPTALDDDAWDAAYRLTLLSAVRLARCVLPAMRRAGWGRIVNVTSLSVREPIPNLTLSNAMRAGVTGFAKTLSLEVAHEGVTVNNLAPGYTATERVEELFPTPQAKQALIDRIPARRMATPAEIADAAAFLASRRAGYITGQTLLVDGGFVGGLM